MPAMLLTAYLTGCGCHAGPPPEESAPLPAAAADICAELQTGSLLFSAGDCLAVRMFTASPFTHVAAVVVSADGERLVYDSTSGVGVRRLPLARYLATQSPLVLYLHHPARPFTAEQARAFSAYLESQLGRPYAIAHHLSGERCTGLHCSEYVTDALMAIELLHAHQPSRVSPASLREGITRHAVYTAGRTIAVSGPATSVAPESNGCARLWLETKACCRDCCRQLSAWFLCR